eukprot:GHVH01000602.1.p1 GENE.GHVH01000602.1~~GHVH01000602.1.p1  ORF type:complete len:408 (+),score=59.90 GHVH01000602.1:165-1388(+)
MSDGRGTDPLSSLGAPILGSLNASALSQAILATQRQSKDIIGMNSSFLPPGGSRMRPMFTAEELLYVVNKVSACPRLMSSLEEVVAGISAGRYENGSLHEVLNRSPYQQHDFNVAGATTAHISSDARHQVMNNIAPILNALSASADSSMTAAAPTAISPSLEVRSEHTRLSHIEEVDTNDSIDGPIIREPSTAIFWYEKTELFNAVVTDTEGNNWSKLFSVEENNGRSFALEAAEAWVHKVMRASKPSSNQAPILMTGEAVDNETLLKLVQDCARKNQNIANIGSTAPVPPPFGLNKKVSNTGIRGITWQESRKKFQCSIYMEKGKRIQKYFPTGLNSFGPRYEEAFRRAKSWMAKMELQREQQPESSSEGGFDRFHQSVMSKRSTLVEASAQITPVVSCCLPKHNS